MQIHRPVRVATTTVHRLHRETTTAAVQSIHSHLRCVQYAEIGPRVNIMEPPVVMAARDSLGAVYAKIINTLAGNFGNQNSILNMVSIKV